MVLRRLLAAWLALLAAGAVASPTGKGSLTLGGSLQVMHLSSHSVYDADSRYDAAFTGQGYYGFSADLSLPFREWLELQVGASVYKYQWQYLEQVAPSFGTLRRNYEQPGVGTTLGLEVHTQGLLEGGWRPLPWRSPDGPLYWPRLGVWVARYSSKISETIGEQSGVFSAYKAQPYTDEVLEANYTVHVPLSRRFSLGAAYGHQQLDYQMGETWVYSRRDGSDWYNIDADLFMGTPDKDWAEVPGAYHPELGWPGQWKLHAYYGFDSIAGDASVGSAWYGFSGAVPFNDLLSLNLGVRATSFKKIGTEYWGGFTADKVGRSILDLYLKLTLNLGAPTLWSK